MARDKSYDMLFNLEDSGYEGFGEPGDNAISYLLNQPSNPGEFLKMNKDTLDEGKMGLLSKVFNVFQNPFSSLYEEEEEDPFNFNEDEDLNLDWGDDDIEAEPFRPDPTKNVIGGEKVKRKETGGGSYGGHNPRY